MGKKLISGSGMNIPYHISEKMFLGLTILKFFDEGPDPGSGTYLTLDPGSGMEKKHAGSATLPPNPYNTPNVTPLHVWLSPRSKIENSGR
jgi:hypothetical protein